MGRAVLLVRALMNRLKHEAVRAVAANMDRRESRSGRGRAANFLAGGAVDAGAIPCSSAARVSS